MTADNAEPVSNADSACNRPRRRRAAIVVGVAIVTVLAGLAGWLAVQEHRTRVVQQEHAIFLQVGRQVAVNLTTMDHNRVEADIQRVLDSSTGEFYADFNTRATAFADVVRSSQSTTEGTVVEAAVESATTESAEILAAVSVKTANVTAPEPQLRHWRMRLTVQNTNDGAKVSKVGFVP